MTLYKKLGGDDGIAAAVTLFYSKVAADDRVARFFETMDMDAQIDKQIAFMTYAFDGPTQYSGRDLRTAHEGLVARGLGDLEFDAIVELLDAALVELEVEQGVRQRVAAVVESTRDAVLGRGDV